MQISSSPYIVALTGGIASGKTAASSHFEKLGAHIVDTDLISRQCTPPGSPALKTIEAAFGPQSVDKDGHLNRAWMREHIFNHPQARAKLENIVSI